MQPIGSFASRAAHSNGGPNVDDWFQYFTERYTEYGYPVLFLGVLLENAGVRHLHFADLLRRDPASSAKKRSQSR